MALCAICYEQCITAINYFLNFELTDILNELHALCQSQ